MNETTRGFNRDGFDLNLEESGVPTSSMQGQLGYSSGNHANSRMIVADSEESSQAAPLRRLHQQGHHPRCHVFRTERRVPQDHFDYNTATRRCNCSGSLGNTPLDLQHRGSLSSAGAQNDSSSFEEDIEPVSNRTAVHYGSNPYAHGYTAPGQQFPGYVSPNALMVDQGVVHAPAAGPQYSGVVPSLGSHSGNQEAVYSRAFPAQSFLDQDPRTDRRRNGISTPSEMADVRGVGPSLNVYNAPIEFSTLPSISNPNSTPSGDLYHPSNGFDLETWFKETSNNNSNDPWSPMNIQGATPNREVGPFRYTGMTSQNHSMTSPTDPSVNSSGFRPSTSPSSGVGQLDVSFATIRLGDVGTDNSAQDSSISVPSLVIAAPDGTPTEGDHYPYSPEIDRSVSTDSFLELDQLSLGYQDVASSPIPSLYETTDVSICCVDGCNTVFRGRHRKGNLARHRRIQHGREDNSPVVFPCARCNREFRRKDARLKHYRTHHRELAREGPVLRGPKHSQYQAGS